MVSSRLLTRAAGVMLLLPLLSGCVYGALYSSTTEPLDSNLSGDLRGFSCGESGTKELSLPVTSANVSVAWNSCALADAALQANLKQIDYADIHTLSVLFGIWRQRTVQVYGRGADGDRVVTRGDIQDKEPLRLARETESSRQ